MGISWNVARIREGEVVAGSTDGVQFRPIDYPAYSSAVSTVVASGVVPGSEASPRSRSRRLVNISKVTASYDRNGKFPAPKLFQIARPQPEYQPYGSIISRETVDESAARLTEAYAPRRESRTGMVDKTA